MFSRYERIFFTSFGLFVLHQMLYVTNICLKGFDAFDPNLNGNWELNETLGLFNDHGVYEKEYTFGTTLILHYRIDHDWPRWHIDHHLNTSNILCACPVENIDDCDGNWICAATYFPDATSHLGACPPATVCFKGM